LNSGREAAAEQVLQGEVMQGCSTQSQPPLPSDAELFDDADEVGEELDLGSLILGDGGEGKGKERGCNGKGGGVEEGAALQSSSSSSNRSWEIGNMRVRLMDWLESLQLQQQQGEGPVKGHERPRNGGQEHSSGPIDPKQFYANDLLRMEDNSTLQGKGNLNCC